MENIIVSLLDALSNDEEHIESEEFISIVKGLLFSDNKRIAQSAVICLMSCCGEEGKEVVEEVIRLGLYLPHKNLIIGMYSLLIKEGW